MSAALQSFLSGRVVLHGGDCLDVLDTLPAHSVDAVITDPPYHFNTIVKRFGGEASAPAGFGTDGAFARASAGFMGKSWDGGDIAFRPETWAKVLRVLKPGGHLAAFSAPKCVHKMGMAIELAGFEMRDRIVNLFDPVPQVVAFLESLTAAQADVLFRLLDHFGPLGEAFWIFGSGFPKSHDVSKAIDGHLFLEWLKTDIVQKARFDHLMRWATARDKRKVSIGLKSRLHAAFMRRHGFSGDVVASGDPVKRMIPGADQHKEGWEKTNGREYQPGDYCPATDEVAQWAGWGTALKPAYEPILIARAPLAEKSVAAQVLATGTGAINIDGCRVETTDSLGGGMVSMGRPKVSDGWDRPWMHNVEVTEKKKVESAEKVAKAEALGRFPANLAHDGSDTVMAGFPDSDGAAAPVSGTEDSETGQNGIYGRFSRVASSPVRKDSGSAARFFYTAKADAHDRVGSGHPTVKPLDLMQWLAKMLCPPGGTILDPFAGTGTTGEAAFREGFNAILIERGAEYRADIARRMDLVLAGPATRSAESVKAKAARRGHADHGPLFGGLDTPTVTADGSTENSPTNRAGGALDAA